ncbi:ABC transporter substrate-binding protein [Paenibacillus ginsengarvi]|uniref:ABC transporter substrate-binding protein n=1 Tax=Paenibacillus ginsengarvi TaxID=400777 RepID=UPI0011C3BC1B|nr:extracellular solute-binding protein [Paenibacillus ginsengarvi]
MAVGMLAGCGVGGNAEAKLKELGKDEQATIKVMSMYDERMFYQQFGALFSAKYPNIDVQVVSTQGAIKFTPDTDYNKEITKFIDEQKPDVLILTLDQYEKMAGEGRLYELDSVIKQDKFDIAGILPSVLGAIKSRSGEKLYGLAPGFSAQALFYNKTLFTAQGVPLPQDEMTWEQVLELARRFPNAGNDASRPYGISLGTGDSLFRFIMMLGQTKGLNFVDASTMTMTMKSEGWKKVAQQSLDAFKSKAIYQSKDQFRSGTMEEYYKQEPFIGGKVAMTLNGAYYLDTLKQAKTALKDGMPQWDLVSYPAEPGNPDSQSTITVTQIFAVNGQSPSVRAAWEFVKYINSDEFARVTSKAPTMGNFPSRTTYMKDAEGHNLEAFYKGKGNSAALGKSLAGVPESFVGQLYGIAEQQFKDAMDGKITLDEALQAIQDKGQAALTKAKQEEEQKKKEK